MNSGLKKTSTKTNKKTLDITTGSRRFKTISAETSNERREKKTGLKRLQNRKKRKLRLSRIHTSNKSVSTSKVNYFEREF